MAKKPASGKLPWLKFYPADWRADPALRMCSIAARGLWMEMLCLMHDAEPCGSLLINGKQVTARQISALAGLPQKDVDALIQELDEAGVFSRDEDGTIYSRRIRRDILKAERDRANGKGGGNPNITGEDNPPDKPRDNGGVNPPPNPQPNPGDKAHVRASADARAAATQRPEARVQKEDSPAAAESFPGRPPPSLEQRCRAAVGDEPCLAAPDFGAVLRVLDETGIVEADVLAGIADGLAKADPGFKFRKWSQFAGWIRGAARDRLDARPGRTPPKASSEPSVYVPGVGDVPEANVDRIVTAWRTGGSWHEPFGPPPDDPRCLLPKRFCGPRLVEAVA